MPRQRESQENSEAEQHNISYEEIERLREEAKQSMSGHGWVQRGTEVICDTCPLSHAFYVSPGTIMTGIDDNGNPILEKIKF